MFAKTIFQAIDFCITKPCGKKKETNFRLIFQDIYCALYCNCRFVFHFQLHNHPTTYFLSWVWNWYSKRLWNTWHWCKSLPKYGQLEGSEKHGRKSRQKWHRIERKTRRICSDEERNEIHQDCWVSEDSTKLYSIFREEKDREIHRLNDELKKHQKSAGKVDEKAFQELEQLLQVRIWFIV